MASSDEDSGMSKPSGPGVKPSATPLQPSLPWRMTSSLVMGLTAALSKGFLYTFNSVEVTGLDGFLKILDERKDVGKRERGLITGTYLSTQPTILCSGGLILPSSFESHQRVSPPLSSQ